MLEFAGTPKNAPCPVGQDASSSVVTVPETESTAARANAGQATDGRQLGACGSPFAELETEAEEPTSAGSISAGSRGLLSDNVGGQGPIASA